MENLPNNTPIIIDDEVKGWKGMKGIILSSNKNGYYNVYIEERNYTIKLNKKHIKIDQELLRNNKINYILNGK